MYGLGAPRRPSRVARTRATVPASVAVAVAVAVAAAVAVPAAVAVAPGRWIAPGSGPSEDAGRALIVLGSNPCSSRVWAGRSGRRE
jgi:hypothetical protein